MNDETTKPVTPTAETANAAVAATATIAAPGVMATVVPGAQNRNTLAVKIKDKASLYASYMPFIKGGALFIPTTQMYHLNDEVTVILQFMEEPDQLTFKGKVVWITPRGAQGGRAAGIGVKIAGDASGGIHKKIETILAGSEKAERPTHTL
jgi:type IV pilus assembly protein PilZ